MTEAGFLCRKPLFEFPSIGSIVKAGFHMIATIAGKKSQQSYGKHSWAIVVIIATTTAEIDFSSIIYQTFYPAIVAILIMQTSIKLIRQKHTIMAKKWLLYRHLLREQMQERQAERRDQGVAKGYSYLRNPKHHIKQFMMLWCAL